MYSMLGKRKRDVVVRHRQDSTAGVHSNPPGTSDLFRKYFESEFEPLPNSTIATPPLLEDESESEAEGATDGTDWEGLSDEDLDSSTVQVIENHVARAEFEADSLRSSQYKAFMSSRPPREAETSATTRSKKPVEDNDDAETLNLKHDLDLQRLLKESHLLEGTKSLSAPGANRHKATDMRMQALGSKTSILAQEKMPLSHRKGISAKATARETLRRKDAQVNGVILEKASKTTRSVPNRRDRGVDVPAVGRFRGGTLKLNPQDIASIHGPTRGVGRKKRGRR